MLSPSALSKPPTHPFLAIPTSSAISIEYADEIFEKLENGAHIYFCGLKGMMPGIQDMLATVATRKGLNYDTWIKDLKAKKQWHVEVY
jgi:ferredoxin--NADP+ reductase